MKNNKYTKWYLSIIAKGVDRADPSLSIAKQKKMLNDTIGYVERHHIHPRCLGGKNVKENMVFLTGREHVLCHWLLCFMYDGNEKYKMWHAFGRTRVEPFPGTRKFSSRLCEVARKKHAEAASIFHRTRLADPNERAKMKKRADEYYSVQAHRDIQRDSISAYWKTDGARQRQSEALTAFSTTEEGRKLRSAAGKLSKENRWSDPFLVDQAIVKYKITRVNNRIVNYPLLTSADDLEKLKEFICSSTKTVNELHAEYGLSTEMIYNWKRTI